MAMTTEGYTLTIGDLQQVVPMAFPDGETERQFSALLRSGDEAAVKVRITPASDEDVQGHALAGAERSFVINVGLDDDTEGHAISVQFPTVADADKFRRRLMAAGLITGTIALGSIGAVTVANLPAANDVSFPANTAVYERPAGHGMLEGVDITDAAPAAAAAATTQASGIDPATGRPARSGMLEGVDGGVANAAATAAAASETSGIDPVTGKPARSGFLEGVDGGLAGGGAANLGSTTAERPAGHGPLEGVDR
jgi:hypothetical protein